MKKYYVNTLGSHETFGPFISFASAKRWADYINLGSFSINDRPLHVETAKPYIPRAIYKDAGEMFGE